MKANAANQVLWCAAWKTYPHTNFISCVTVSSNSDGLWIVNVNFQKIAGGAVSIHQVLGFGIQPASVGHRRFWHFVVFWTTKGETPSNRLNVLKKLISHPKTSIGCDSWSVQLAKYLTCSSANSYSCGGQPPCALPCFFWKMRWLSSVTLQWDNSLLPLMDKQLTGMGHTEPTHAPTEPLQVTCHVSTCYQLSVTLMEMDSRVYSSIYTPSQSQLSDVFFYLEYIWI